MEIEEEKERIPIPKIDSPPIPIAQADVLYILINSR